MSDLLNTGQFWNLEKDFFDESVNSNPLNYNTYEEFITGSKSNLNLKKFQYEDPFKFTPSYGSSVSIIFYQDTPSMGDSYVSVNQALMNRVEISFDLQFNDRGNEETDRLNSYIDSKEGHKVFPFQMFNQNDLTSQELYKSLYSLPPYFVQEFKCVEKQMENIYTDHNSMKLTLLNQDYSQFSVRNILRVNSMPQEKKDIIDEYSSKYHLDIKPSYSITRDEEYNLDRFQMGNRTRPFEKSKGINKTITDIRLEFNAITDDILLKLLAFFISKQGFETFTFDLENPDLKTLNYFCRSIDHTYLFTNSHSLSVSLEESYIRRRFHWGY